MRENVDWFKLGTGISLKDIEDSFQLDLPGAITVEGSSQFERILLGRDAESGRPFYASAEQLQHHMHIMGPSKKGKSTTVIELIQELALRGFPSIVFDASAGGDTVYKLINFWNQHDQKYLLIDLRRLENPVINSLHRDDIYQDKYKSVVHLDDAFQVGFGIKDLSETPLIAKYLKAVLHVLWNAGLVTDHKPTIVEAKYFTDKTYISQREYLLGKSQEAEQKFGFDSHHRILIEEAYKNPRLYERFISTTSRLEPLNHPAIQALFGDVSSVNIGKLLDEGYHIGVVSSYDDLEDIQNRLVVTILLNEFLYHHRGQPYFLWLDEAQDYATTKLGELLDKKAKTGLNICLINHHLDQFEDEKLRRSVMVNTAIKYEFMKKREAYVKLNEMDEVYLRMNEVQTEKGTPTTSPFNRTRTRVLNNIKQRIPYDPREDSGPAEPGTTPNQPSDSPHNPPTGGGRLWEDLPAGDESPGTPEG